MLHPIASVISVARAAMEVLNAGLTASQEVPESVSVECSAASNVVEATVH